jgi:DNA-binding SARP family transcriptional activator
MASGRAGLHGRADTTRAGPKLGGVPPADVLSEVTAGLVRASPRARSPVHNGSVGARTARWLAWSLFGVSIVLAIVGTVLNVVGHPTATDLNYGVDFSTTFLGFSLVGALVASRLPRNPIGWLLLTQGLCWELSGALAGYANYVLFARPDFLAGGTVAAWALNWLYLPAIAAAILLFLLFPDGRLPSRRWLPMVWLLALGLLLSLGATMVAPGPLRNARPVANPFPLHGWQKVIDGATPASNFMFTLAGAAAVLSLVLRFRRAGGIERHQLKWLALAACLVFLAFAAYDFLGAIGLSGLAENVGPPSLLAIPIAVGVAILRYHLYDIDVIISKTVVYAGLAAFITVVYVALVVGVGAAVGRGTGSNLALAVVATALVAVAFQPVRDRLHRVARRFVFGPPTPAEEQAGLAIRSLGAFRVFRDGDLVPLTAWQSKKARTLLKILVARRGRSTTREYLMEALWPEESPDVVTRRLSVALATVRAVLDPAKNHPADHFVIADKDAIRLDLATVPVDVEGFLAVASEGLARYAEGRADDAEIQLATAERAYEGDFLEEDMYEDWAAPLREEARTTYISVLRVLAAQAEASEHPDDAVRRYLRILEVDPWDEGAHLALVGTMERVGRHGEARRRYVTYVSRMDEIGLPTAPFPTAGPAQAASSAQP